MPDFQFESLADFLAMGGDALFVWSSYFVFALFIGWNLIQPRLLRRKIVKLLQARRQREVGMQQSMSGQGSRVAE